MKIKIWQLLFGLLLVVSFLLDIKHYTATTCIQPFWGGPDLCGNDARAVCYIYMLFIIIGLIIFVTSIKRKK